MSELLKKLKDLDAKLEWPVRILFTVVIVYTVLKTGTCEEHGYPFPEFIMTVLALWLYFFGKRLPAILILLFQLMIAYFHNTY